MGDNEFIDIAKILHRFFVACIESGFTEKQAIKLTIGLLTQNNGTQEVKTNGSSTNILN